MMSSLDYPWNLDQVELSIPGKFRNSDEIKQSKARWAELTQALSAKIKAVRDERPKIGMGAFETALLLEDCLRTLSEYLADARVDTIHRAFSLMDSLLEDLLQPNAREKALLERSSLLVRVQYEFDNAVR